MKETKIEKINALLSKISDETVSHYKTHQNSLTHHVNQQMTLKEDIHTLIGGQPLSLMEMNHKNHADFMYSIFLTKDATSTYETYLWAYNAYSKKGFMYEYFYVELNYWVEALEDVDKTLFHTIISLYKYLISLHDHFVEHSITSNVVVASPIDEKIYQEYLDALLTADVERALEISYSFIQQDEDIKLFWEGVILPSLYTIGYMWEVGEISVGEEHIATSICQRIMAEHYSKILTHIEHTTKVLVTTSPEELHEIGSRMLADVLELNGFDVSYLSSNASIDEICHTLKREEIHHMIISTTLEANLPNTTELIKKIRTACETNDLKIIVGGQAYKKNQQAKEIVGCDYALSGIDELLALLKGSLNYDKS